MVVKLLPKGQILDLGAELIQAFLRSFIYKSLEAVPGKTQLDVLDGKLSPWTLTSTYSEWQELVLLALHFNLWARYEPNRIKVIGVHPHDRVSLDGINVDNHLGSRTNLESEETAVFVRGFVR